MTNNLKSEKSKITNDVGQAVTTISYLFIKGTTFNYSTLFNMLILVLIYSK